MSAYASDSATTIPSVVELNKKLLGHILDTITAELSERPVSPCFISNEKLLYGSGTMSDALFADVQGMLGRTPGFIVSKGNKKDVRYIHDGRIDLVLPGIYIAWNY